MTTEKHEVPANNTLKMIQAAAVELNYYGKRLKSVKVDLIRTIIEELELDSTDYPSSEIYDWLADNQPVKKAAAKRTAKQAEVAPPSFHGNNAPQTDSLEVLTDSKRFIVTCAQNNTAPHESFRELEVLAERLDARLIVLPVHYNKSAFSPAVESVTENWHPDFAPYLLENDVWLGGRGNVRLVPSANVLPTAKQPINAASDLNGGELATIVASPKQQMKTLPRMAGQAHRWAWTTGAATNYNYLDCRAGAVAESTHTFGALLVAATGNTHKITNLEFRNSKFLLSDIDYFTIEADKPPALVLGDLHLEAANAETWDKTLAQVETVEPKTLVLHDTFDCLTVNGHNRQSAKHRFLMRDRSIMDDLKDVASRLNELAELTSEVLIVRSNHDDMLDRWIDDPIYNPDQDPQNARAYHALKVLLIDALSAQEKEKLVKEPILLEKALTESLFDVYNELPLLNPNIEFLPLDKARIIKGVDVSQHGHKGCNGARSGLQKTGSRMVTGHTHSPAISGNGLFTVGVTAALQQGYNAGGATSWDRCNMVIHENGAIQALQVYAVGIEQDTF